ncbi:MAG: hypothetical protein ABL890_02355 [Candidatus Peribacteraceae bacterium]
MYLDEFGGMESYTPSEGGGAREQLSEESKQRFTQAQAQIKQFIREEKKAKKRDDRVAETIVQFLGNDQYSHLFQLIATLSAMNCPSIFILAILSLIHDGCKQTVEEYVQEHRVAISTPDTAQGTALSKNSELPADARQDLLQWIARMGLVLDIDTVSILKRLMTDHENLDGSVLQITTFVLRDYFASIDRSAPYEELQPLTIAILQDIVGPHLPTMKEYFASGDTEASEEA